MDSKIKYWIELSDYDLETAQVMYDSKRYLYVGFMCHQSIEKIFKALFINNTKGIPPFTHNLSKIAVKGEFFGMLNEYADFIDELEPLNVESRYPSDKDKIFSYLTDKTTIEILKKTKSLQKWIKKLLF